MIPISAKVKEVLTEKYGDYMKQPPVEEKVGRHEWMKFYWKN